MTHPWFRLSSKVKAALVFMLTGDLSVIALGLTGGLPWVGVVAAGITSLAPVLGAWNQTETVYPPLAPDSVAVPVASLKVPVGAVVTMPEPGNATS
jgi:hypothetical protein